MKKNIVFFIGFIFATQCIFSQEIAQWRGPGRNGVFPEKYLLKKWPDNGPELLWKFSELGIGHTSAAVTTDKVYITGTLDKEGVLFALNHRGKVLWKKNYGKEWIKNFPGVRTSPLIYGNHGYILSGTGKLFCFNTENGDEIWSKNIHEDYGGKIVRFGITENLVIKDNMLFCTPGGEETNIIALDRFTGKLIWKNKGLSEPNAYCSPIVIDLGKKSYFITMTAHTIFSIETKTGKTAWMYKFESRYPTHPNSFIYRDNCIFAILGAKSDGGVKLKISDDGNFVKKIWNNKLIDVTTGDAVLIGDKIYSSGISQKKWFCVDWKTGKTIYSQELHGTGTIISANDLLYLYSYTGDFSLVNPTENNFEVMSEFKISGKKKNHWTYPVIKDGKLYIRHANTLWVYSIADK